MQCYLCENNNFVERKGEVRDNKNLKVYECTNCGLVQLNKNNHITLDHYAGSGMYGENVPSIEFMLKSTSEDDNRRFNLLKPLITNKRVLDFGCGNAVSYNWLVYLLLKPMELNRRNVFLIDIIRMRKLRYHLVFMI